MKRLFEIILTILILNSFCMAQEVDKLMNNETFIDFGTDSLYNLQMELKLKQGPLSDCDFAIQNAGNDFNKNIYTLHSDAFSGYCSYCAVLQQDYNINWRFTNDLFSDEYYKCYDSIISEMLIEQYHYDIFEYSSRKADSLNKTDNWIKNAEYPGGQQEMMKFIFSNLQIESDEIQEIKTKLIVEIEIDLDGKVNNPIIRKGISEKIDKKIIDIINQMPNWKPAYNYGKLIKQRYVLPINIDYK